MNKSLDAIAQKFDTPLSKEIISRWNPSIRAEDDEKDNVINIYKRIGNSFFEEGITAEDINEQLEAADGQDIVVNINSGGGSFFEGLAIYSLLSKYDGDVTVRVIGLAASAASIIAMAGDTVEMGEGTFMMIHNAWVMAIGNQFELVDIAQDLKKFDKSASKIYKAKTGLDIEEINEMMKEETWLEADEAIESGFADKLMKDEGVTESVDDVETSLYNSNLRMVDYALAKSGLSRKERREMIKSLTSGTPSAAQSHEKTTRS